MHRREIERFVAAVRAARAAGEPTALVASMRTLARRCAGIVWLNPLADTPGYEPTAAGTRAARPLVTTFANVNDLDGFVRLAHAVRVRA